MSPKKNSKKDPQEQAKLDLSLNQENPEKLIVKTIEDEMRASYIDYAMSVIVGRALPDVRDGLKPVHRRILYSMDELGLQPNRPYKKSARVVGDCLGKYHPHGDSAVYESLVRMAQDFSLRYMLADGQGNFGSIDGDSAAAMRYTEIRLSSMAQTMLSDIDKETIDFVPNFDESLKEPSVLPAKIPNLLINGTSGIAVGMATNMPPHNLSEVIAAIVKTIDNPEITLPELMKILPGPDFPTGGLICGQKGIREAYETGKGVITLRARFHVEELKGGKEAIIITEIPYQTNKSDLILKIVDLVKDKKLVGISDLRDESDRDGLRIYIELKRDAHRDIVLNQLFKHTGLQSSYGINNVALVSGEPRLLNLKDIINCYIGHREEIITRRTQFELKKAEARAHILAGLLIALSNLDAIIKLIRASKTVEEAKNGLMSKFKLTDIQAQAILDMKLQRLTALERVKIENEHKELLAQIKEYKAILASRERILNILKEELSQIKKKFGDIRRTEITNAQEDMEIEDLIPETDVAIVLSREGFIKRMPLTLFRSQLRGGRGVMGMATREADMIGKIFITSTHNYVLFFTNWGKVYRRKAFEIPEAGRTGKGQSVAHLLNLSPQETVTATFPIKEIKGESYLFMATEKGMVKKTTLSLFNNIRQTGIIAINIKEGDGLKWVKESEGSEDVILVTEKGLVIRFSEKNVRSMGRATAGVKGINLSSGDRLVSMDIVTEETEGLVITNTGSGKRFRLNDIRSQNRGGKGMQLIKLKKNSLVARAILVNSEDDVLVITAAGTLSRQKVSGISRQGRYARGVRIQRLDDGDFVVDLARAEKMIEEDA